MKAGPSVSPKPPAREGGQRALDKQFQNAVIGGSN
jgi:hypothetical protein